MRGGGAAGIRAKANLLKVAADGDKKKAFVFEPRLLERARRGFRGIVG
jgi:hypothetical protein